MKYKLKGDNNYLQPLETVLHNRGIVDVGTFLNSRENSSVVTHYSTMKNIIKAVDTLLKHIGGGSNIWIKVDPDT